MVRPAGSLIAACVVASLASGAGAVSPERVSIEYRAWQSDLIVVAEVLSVGEPAQSDVNMHDGRPGTKWVRRYRAKIQRVIKAEKDATGGDAEANSPVGREVTVLDRCAPPGAPVPKAGRWATPQDPVFGLRRAYLLMLMKLPTGEYAVRKFPAPDYKQLATREAIREMETVADPAKWPWGPPDSRGLQLALIARPVSSGFGRMRYLTTSIFVAARNTSKQPLTLSMYGGDKYLSVLARGPGGRRHAHDFYKRLDPVRLPAFSERDAIDLQPGAWFVLSPFGNRERGVEPMHYATFIRMPVVRGKWTFQASYAVSRARTVGRGRIAWTGKIDSRPMTVQVGAGPTTTSRATTTTAPASAPGGGGGEGSGEGAAAP